MKLSRREIVGSGLAASAAIIAGCGKAAFALPAQPKGALSAAKLDINPEAKLVHLVTFGADLDSLQAANTLGYEGYLEQQLAADQPEEPSLEMLLSQCDGLRIDGVEAMDLPRARQVESLQRATLLRAIYSKNQLQERMSGFWRDHFNLFGQKGDVGFFAGIDDAALRKHALGNFYDLLSVSAHSPAMLIYLDNPNNYKGHANENYARELMELHTLGVHGGYTQQDVMEAARCFTGWTWERRFLHLNKGKFRFDETIHAPGSKTVLGVKIAEGGKDEGEQILHLLAHHRQTAKFLTTKLCRYFHGHVDDKLVAKASQAYLAGGGEIKPVLRVILAKEEVVKSGPLPKQPVDFVVSALRATGAQTRVDAALLERLRDMGQLPFEWPMPNGFPLQAQAWTGTMLQRWNFAYDLAHNQIPGVDPMLTQALGRFKDGSAQHEQIASLALGHTHAPAELKSQMHGKSPEQALALAIASPEFQWRA